jgi:hypothetical protein
MTVMRPLASESASVLSFGADWACANGDLGALACVLADLATQVEEPFGAELRRVADMCRSKPELAIDAWLRVKARLARRDARSPRTSSRRAQLPSRRSRAR